MSYKIQAKSSLEFPQVDPSDDDGLKKYFGEDGDRFAKFYRKLNGRPNSRFFAARMTLLNKLSDHKGGPRMVLDPDGADVQSLVGKPIHFVEGLDKHWASDKNKKRDIKTFGVTLGGKVHPAESDGSVPLDVFGLLWDDDHPEMVTAVAEKMNEMGMSWEITAPHSAIRRVEHPDMEQPFLYVANCEFTGTAILRRDKAAYPDSVLLVAGEDSNDIDLDLTSIPLIDSKQIKVTTASAASSLDGVSNKTSPTLNLTFTKKVARKEKPMAFCDSCKDHHETLLASGEYISKADLEHSKFVADMKASVEKAEAAAVEAKELAAKAVAEKEELIKEKEQLQAQAKAETEAIAKWEASKEQYGDDPEIRKTFLDAQEKIILKASVESVSEGFEALRELDKKVIQKTASKDTKKGSRFSAFDTGSQSMEPTEEDKNRTREFVRERFTEENLRAFISGHGINPAAISQPRQES